MLDCWNKGLIMHDDEQKLKEKGISMLKEKIKHPGSG